MDMGSGFLGLDKKVDYWRFLNWCFCQKERESKSMTASYSFNIIEIVNHIIDYQGLRDCVENRPTDQQTIDNPDRQLRNQASKEPWRRTTNRPSQKILRVVDINRALWMNKFKRSDNSNPSILFQFWTLDGFFCPSLSSKVYFSAGRISPNRGLATCDQPELAFLLFWYEYFAWACRI